MTVAHLRSAARIGPANISYLILVLTSRCNLHCSYCYHGEPGERRDMSMTTLDQAFALAAGGSGPLHIQLTGGEPTLAPELIEAAAQRALSLPRACTLGIQSNGTCLDERVIALFKRYQLQVGVSLDGPPAIQEQLRGKAAETLRGLLLLESYGVPFRVTTVVSNRNVEYLDRLAWLLAGFRQALGLGLDLLVVKGTALGAAALSPAGPEALIQGIESLAKALEVINQRRAIPLQLRELELVKRMLASEKSVANRTRSFCYARQGASLAVHPDGRLFPCGQSLGDPQFAAGSLEQTARVPLFPQQTLAGLVSDCRSCPLENRCPGDCPSRLHYNRACNPLLACDLYRTLAAVCLHNTNSCVRGEHHAVPEAGTYSQCRGSQAAGSKPGKPVSPVPAGG